MEVARLVEMGLSQLEALEYVRTVLIIALHA